MIFLNPNFVDDNAGDTFLSLLMESIVLRMLNNIPDHSLGNGDIDIRVSSLAIKALDDLENQGKIKQSPSMFYSLVSDANNILKICPEDGTPMRKKYRQEIITTSHPGYIHFWQCPQCKHEEKGGVEYDLNGSIEQEYRKQYPKPTKP